MPKTDLVSPPSHCALCPRRCGVDRAAGAVGFCGAGRTLKAVSYTHLTLPTTERV